MERGKATMRRDRREAGTMRRKGVRDENDEARRGRRDRRNER
jgi:hypothetical protein